MEIGFFIFAVSSLFTLVDPLGAAPMFVALTEKYDRADVNRIARKGSIAAGVVLLVFAGLGDYIFSMYHLTLNAFRLTGGVIFFRLGLNMLESIPRRTKSTPKEEAEALQKDDIAVTPIGIPLIAGPGAITSVMILMGESTNLYHKAYVFLAIAIVMVITYYILRGSKALLNKLGTSGSRLIHRLMGMLLMVIAAQFFIDGVSSVIIEAMNAVY